MAIPTDLIVAVQFNDFAGQTFDLDYVRDGGSPLATVSGTPLIVTPLAPTFGDGALLVSGNEGVEYLDAGIIDGMVQTGCIRCRFKPSYSGFPAQAQTIFALFKSGVFQNLVALSHDGVVGDLTAGFTDSTGAFITTAVFISGWNPVAGTWYNLELNFDLTAGAIRLFLNGVQQGATDTSTGTRTATADFLMHGSSPGAPSPAQDFVLDELLIFDAVQHTSGYTPDTAEVSYLPSAPLPDVPPPTPGIGSPQWSYEQLSTAVETFLGYRPTADELEGFPFLIYEFIILSLRNRDKNGTLLLKRFLEGPQETWYSLYRAGSKLETIYDPEEVDAEYLPSLRRLVGFGDDLIDVATAASELELRRIIAGAIHFWKKRFLDSGLAAAIRLVTGNRFKIRDWFDFRFIVGETEIAEDLENNDSNMVSHKTRNFFRSGSDGLVRYASNPKWFHSVSTLPTSDDIGGYIVIINDTGSPSNNGFYLIADVDVPQEIFIIETYFPRYQLDADWFIAFKSDEFLTEIRVVDEISGQGLLNRTLLGKLLKLQRPHGERFNVVYVDFIDLFTTVNDFGQWEDLGLDAYTYSVDDGALTLATTATLAGVTTNRSTAADWVNYEWKTKAALQSNGTFRCAFYDGWFWLAVSYSGFATGTFRIWANPTTPVALTAAFPFPDLSLDAYWTYTIEVYNLPSGDVNIKLLVDGNKIFDFDVASTQLKGNIQYLVETDTTVEIAETELWQYPLDIDRIGPNP